MSNDRALFWIFATTLMGFGLLAGQEMAIGTAAMVAAYLAYEGSKPTAAS